LHSAGDGKESQSSALCIRFTDRDARDLRGYFDPRGIKGEVHLRDAPSTSLAKQNPLRTFVKSSRHEV
jgi:hypothetical protein